MASIRVDRLALVDVCEGGVESYALVLSLLALDAHHFLNCLANVKGLRLLSELSCLNLSIVEHVLHQECHEVGT